MGTANDYRVSVVRFARTDDAPVGVPIPKANPNVLHTDVMSLDSKLLMVERDAGRRCGLPRNGNEGGNDSEARAKPNRARDLEHNRPGPIYRKRSSQ
jgi:hypothetical protein